MRLAAWTAGLCIIACGAVAASAEKPGATIVAQAADGRTVEGELLSVGIGEIEVLAKGEAAKVLLRLDELDRLGIKKKDRTLKGLGTGLLIGAGWAWESVWAWGTTNRVSFASQPVKKQGPSRSCSAGLLACLER
jgi:hypothetical protein